MNSKTISIHVQSEENYSIGNIRALLTEIGACLEKLDRKNETGMIDLNSLPFAPGEYEQLRRTLGQGEVSVHIEAIGKSEVFETQYPGVWWVTHYNVEGNILADMLEITTIPEIIKSQPEDVHAGLEKLQAQLSEVHDGS
jgi:hydrogenase-1 operon protein HyaF